MKLGLLLLNGEMKDLVATARRAEAAGFSGVYVAEVYRSAWVLLTAIAAATERISIGPYVINAYARSPLVAGMSAIDFNEFANGRLVLGVGGGNREVNEVWQGIPHARVLTKLREYVQILQRMARCPAGEALHFEGKIHRMQWTPVVQPLATPFPVFLAAVFPDMLRVAAACADGIAGGATLSAEYLKNVMQPRAAAYAEAAGRDPAGLRWRSVMFAAVNDDREQARHDVRAALCRLYAPLPHPYYEYTMREQGFGAVVDQLLRLMPAGETEAAIKAIPDEAVDLLCIAGTKAECQAKVRAYEGVVEELLLVGVGGDVVGVGG